MSFRRLRSQPHLFEGQQRRRAYSHGDLSYLPLLTSSSSTEEKLLSLREKILYTLPWLPFTFSQGIFNVWSYNFYSNVLNLNTMNVGWMITVAVFLLQVPFAAYIQDNWITRFGRRRHYMIFLAPFYFLSLFAMFYIPPFPDSWGGFSRETMLAVYFTVTMTLVVLRPLTQQAVLQNLIQAPFTALGYELTPNFDERSALFSWIQVASAVMSVAAYSLPQFLLSFLSPARVFLILCAACAAFGIFSFWLSAFLLTERVEEIEKVAVSQLFNPQVPLVTGIRFSLTHNQPFLVLLASISFAQLAPYLGHLLPYWVQYTLRLTGPGADPLKAPLLLFAFVAGSFALVPLWEFLAKVWGKRKAYLLANLIAIPFFALMALPRQGDFWLPLLLVTVVGGTGIPITSSNFLWASMNGDCIEYDELQTGTRREAQVLNLMQYFAYLGTIGSTTAPFWLLQYFGFDATEESSADQDLIAEVLAYIMAAPAAFTLLAVVALCFYRLDKATHGRIVDGLAQHRAGLSALDPFTTDVIPSHQDMDPAVAQQFWTLEGFAHWELRRLPLLPLVVAGQILFWLSIGASTGLLLWQFPAYYWVTG